MGQAVGDNYPRFGVESRDRCRGVTGDRAKSDIQVGMTILVLQ